MSKPKFVVFKLKELLLTATLVLFAVALIILVISQSSRAFPKNRAAPKPRHPFIIPGCIPPPWR